MYPAWWFVWDVRAAHALVTLTWTPNTPGSCRNGAGCAFKHSKDAKEDRRCPFYTKGNCHHGAKCEQSLVPLPLPRRCRSMPSTHIQQDSLPNL
jgi:hypothetical protein